MLVHSSAVSVYVCLEPTDMRKSFDSLSGLVYEIICQNPLSGHLFVFVRKRRTMLKILFWDRTGYCQYYKRLENGTFSLPSPEEVGAGSIRISYENLRFILDGIDILGAKRKK